MVEEKSRKKTDYSADGIKPQRLVRVSLSTDGDPPEEPWTLVPLSVMQTQHRDGGCPTGLLSNHFLFNYLHSSSFVA